MQGFRKTKAKPGALKTPLIMVRVIPDSPEEFHALREACSVLSSEDPLLHAQYTEETREIQLQVMGKVQLERNRICNCWPDLEPAQPDMSPARQSSCRFFICRRACSMVYFRG